MRSQDLLPPGLTDYFTNIFNNRLRSVGDQVSRGLPVSPDMILGYSGREIAEHVITAFYTMPHKERIEFMRLIAPKGVTVNEPD